MKKYFYLILFLKASIASAASTDTLRIFFDLNISSLKTSQSLDSVLEISKEISSVRIFGYADYLGTVSKNKILSEDRAKAVKKYLQSKNPSLHVVTCEGKGQVDQDVIKHLSIGDPFNRRVDVVIQKKETIKKEIVKEEAPALPEKNHDRKILELEVGESVAMHALKFEGGRHVLIYESLPALEELYHQLDSAKTIHIEILGHICCRDGAVQPDGLDFDTQKWNLSESRARYVYDYLVQKGIDKKRLQYRGLGSKYPIVYPERTLEDQQINRSVEIVVTAK